MHVQSRRWSLGLVPPLLLALGLRWLGLHSQILTDDELHAVHGALAMPVRDIVQTWTFGGADYGVPQAAFYRVLMDQGFVFSEFSFRIPSLLAGLVAVFVLPCLAVNRIGERAAVVLAWLLAISPMLTLYSRIVRPYMPATLLATAAVLFFFRWWTTRSTGSAIGYVLCAVSAVYFHLVAAPLVLAPLAYAVVDGFIRGEADRNRLIRLFSLGSITVLLILAALLPAYESIFEIVNQKRDGLAPGLQNILDVTRLQIGTRVHPHRNPRRVNWPARCLRAVARRPTLSIFYRQPGCGTDSGTIRLRARPDRRKHGLQSLLIDPAPPDADSHCIRPH